MTKTVSLLILSAFLSGCATRVWSERTDETRPLGPTEVVTTQRPLADEYFEASTRLEQDGYQWSRTVRADDDGDIVINLLPVALQCLVYGHDVSLELYAIATGEVEYTFTVNAARAHSVIEEWSIQANLGAEVPLTRKESDLLIRLMRATPRPEVLKQLEAIKEQETVRFDWE